MQTVAIVPSNPEEIVEGSGRTICCLSVLVTHIPLHTYYPIQWMHLVPLPVYFSFVIKEHVWSFSFSIDILSILFCFVLFHFLRC